MARGGLEQRAERRAGRGIERSTVRQRIRSRVTRHPRSSLFGALLMLYVLTGTYHVASIDVIAAAEPARVLATHGTLDLSGVPHSDLWWYFDHDGGVYSDRFPGAILYLVPAYWLGDLLGLHQFTLIPGVFTAALVTALAVVVLGDVLRRVVPTDREAWIGAAFIGVGTGAWSVAANAPWSHTMDLLLISLALLALTRDRWLLAGVPLGLAVATRPTMAVAAAAMGLVLGVQQRSVWPPVRIAVGAIPGVVLLFAYNGLLFGRWGPSNGHELGGEIVLRLGELPLNVLGALFSPTRGLLVYYPVLVLAAFTLVSAWRAAAAWERASFLAGGSVLVLQLSLNRYSGGEAFFGPRLMIEPLALAVPVLARAVHEFGQRHGARLLSWALVAGVVIHGLGRITVSVLGGSTT